MDQLKLHKNYSRKDVHDIFAPDTPFTPSRGAWGMQGIIKIPDRPKDFIFFVTYGQQQGEHVFEEGITEEGVLSWQSQPSQSLSTPQIKQLIQHDDLNHSIYLFLRTNKRSNYIYLGKLRYLSHDYEREKPVWFQWQLIDWPVPHEINNMIGFRSKSLTPKEPSPIPAVPFTGRLIETQPPKSPIREGTSTSSFRALKNVDYSKEDAKNKKMGQAGELLVLQYEKERLENVGRYDLSQKVRHVSEIEGDGAGYDIKSYSSDGSPRYIEVKTTKGSIHTAFYMSSNEVAFAREHYQEYFLYRVYDYDKAINSGKFYVGSGKIDDNFSLTPIQYRVR